MRHFLLVAGAVAGNFILWSLATILPVHVMIIFCLVIAAGCLMIYVMVRFGMEKDADTGPTGRG